MHQPSEEVTVPVVEAAADALGREVEDLPPLSESVPIDSLDEVVSDPAQDVTVTFSYAGLWVLVCSGNTVFVSPADDERIEGIPPR